MKKQTRKPCTVDCPPDCGHTTKEHIAFDRGMQAASIGGTPGCPYSWDNEIAAWNEGLQAGIKKLTLEAAAKPIGHQVTTRFALGQVIWFMHDNRPTRGQVQKVNVEIIPGDAERLTYVRYTCRQDKYTPPDYLVDEPRAFASREALVASL